ncbi:MAG TPA: 3-methyl-2-oxobutanoate dehydrogenase subunit VorB [Bacillota bacterium]|jgi:2-oxoglutarate ferredoxin oxidoreductase subunit alpha|nr:3-methyl-2-oxobutanoate dehydrogenase subunit VorB [Bacillota bacterium]HQJ36559.1 3-methyl-2-oxobutanoate dehydrogenase subunit VorB [Bacillota bacterium]HQL36403.1 3-methyl-2-oxobutanoate dehydrogenase subunit VorB [Bacillota bacterium]HRS22293.1 3-methyl-2-oxobutanoate dehydrogenase subunit VorB [Clostridia bacterium]HRU40831.1 3-methyl-2-oxobutanoate dehydrogenase subunit VorB [Candidatus Diapherotrites archaeon]
MAKELWKGNEAVAEAAIKAGCRFFFGYPITPQNEIPEYMAMKMPQVDGCFLQAESEIAAINMVYGAAGSGARVMTSSSSPGISLKQEGITYIAGAELPCVIVNMVRGGPGLGGIQPAQSDYFQACKGGGHGDYRLVVLAPASVQEAVDLVQEAFDIADQYRNPVMVLGDGMIGQMMEPVEFTEVKKRSLPEKTWATVGTKGKRKPNVINSLFIDPADCEKHNFHLFEKYAEIEKNEIKVEEYNLEGAEIVFAAYGTIARIVKNAINSLAKEGIKAGLIRPITLWPFPAKSFEKAAEQAGVKAFMSVEMSMGQMVEDVKLSVNGKKPVYFYGRTGGMFPTPKAVAEEAKKILGGAK